MNLSEYVEGIKEKSIGVIGIGVSNTPLLELLLAHDCDVTARDIRTRDQLGTEADHLEKMGAKLRLGPDYLEGLDEQILFRTPGLMPFEEHLQKAQAQGSLLTSEMEVFLQLCPCRVIAVTGSDGKTTTSTIIAELLKAAGFRVHLGGNIGNPLLCEIPDIREDDIAVLELSSFQLHSMKCCPDVAVITNISPNHLDKHRDYQDYIDAKREILLHQRPDCRLILNADDAQTPYFESIAAAKLSYFSDRQQPSNGAYLADGVLWRVKDDQPRKVLAASEIRLPGEHNVLNYLAAFAAVEGLVDDETCARIAKSFGGVEHRLEFVRELRGVTYINDSIGTSPTRTIAGLKAMRAKPLVIAGGYDKHLPFDELGDALCQYAKSVWLTGSTAGKIRDAIVHADRYKDNPIPVRLIEDFRETVLAAAEAAGEGDIVLFSPACASFDRFPNFAERGKAYKAIIRELK